MSIPDQWVERARYDLDTARAMLTSGRYLYVIFCCQQAVEKALKALIAQQTGEMPPRLHNLSRLAEAANVQPDADRTELLLWLTNAYIRSRYPGQPGAPDESLDATISSQILSRTEETCEWLLSLLR